MLACQRYSLNSCDIVRLGDSLADYFPAGLESSLRLLLASRGTRQGQHYRLLVISSNQDRRQTAHARTALTASACLVWVLLRASWFSALSVKILFLLAKFNKSA